MSDAILYDVVADLKTALKCDWNPCTVSVPSVEFMWDVKATGFAGSVQNTIIIQPLGEAITPFALHGDAWMHELSVKIDIRTYGTLANHNTVIKEAGRVLKNILRRAGETPVAFLDAILKGYESDDADYRNLFRGSFTIVYRDVTAFTFT